MELARRFLLASTLLCGVIVQVMPTTTSMTGAGMTEMVTEIVTAASSDTTTFSSTTNGDIMSTNPADIIKTTAVISESTTNSVQTEIVTEASPEEPTSSPTSSSAMSTSSDKPSMTSLPSTMITTSTNQTTIVTEAPSEEPTTLSPAMSTSSGESSTAPAKVGPVPHPSYPDLEGDFIKQFRFEVSVHDQSTDGCQIDIQMSSECQAFKSNFTTQLQEVYDRKPGFLGVEIIGLRRGSIIVTHAVNYSYNGMDDADRGASPQTIYDETLGEEVADGALGNYSVNPVCTSCSAPEELSDICKETYENVCGEYSKEPCRDKHLVCESICDTNYCHGHGICWQKELEEAPTCSCDWDEDHWYWGYSCQFYANELYLIIGCSCGGAVFLILVIVLIICACRKPSSKTTKTNDSPKMDSEEIQAFQNFGYTSDIFPPVDDIDQDEGLSRQRPYSYIYTTSDDGGNPKALQRNQNGSRIKENRPNSMEGGKRQSAGSSEKHPTAVAKTNDSSTRGDDFWGNLREPNGEHIEMKPVLDHIDVNEDYKIQRPRISMVGPNYPAANTGNYYHSSSMMSEHYYSTAPPSSVNIPEPDYGQR